MTSDFWLATEDVERALQEGEPVVALESTVLAHGLPRPRNLDVGQQLEADIRAVGAVPATIAVVDGTPRIGLTAAQLDAIALDDGIVKLSTKDLPVAIARGQSGGTTVAATASLAHSAGIQVFATGGIGGVHRGSPLDVSADLSELQRIPILVVCAGAKSILDLPATREALESLGILVLGWRTRVFPEFYTAGRDLEVDASVDGAEEVAEIWSAHRRATARTAVVLCVPVPEAAAVDRVDLASVTDRALAAAMSGGVKGKELTPFLLREVARETRGASLEANVALLRNNARVAAEVAMHIARS